MNYFISIFTFFVLILTQNEIYCQNIEGNYRYKNSLCSNSIIIGSNNLAFREGGCEGNSHINWGTWKQKQDTLQLIPWRVELKYPFLKQIDYTKDSSNKLNIIVLDILGKDISNHINLKIKLLNNDSIYYVQELDDFLSYEEFPTLDKDYFKHMKLFEDSHTCKKISDIAYKNIKTIEILRINMLIGEKMIIDIEQGNNIKIQFNFPEDFFYYPTVMKNEEWLKMDDIILIGDNCLCRDEFIYDKK